jgi:hypothetical protein
VSQQKPQDTLWSVRLPTIQRDAKHVIERLDRLYQVTEMYAQADVVIAPTPWRHALADVTLRMGRKPRSA